MALRVGQIEQNTSELRVAGSTPAGRAFFMRQGAKGALILNMTFVMFKGRVPDLKRR